MSTLRQWDIVVLPFPYIDRAREKKRPALIVSDARMHEEFGTCWAMMITSAKKSRWACDVPIRSLEQAGLPVACVIRPVKLASVETARILRRTGRIGAVESRKVAAFLQHHLPFKRID